MRCRNCRFNLVCHMGRLGLGSRGGAQGAVHLCPICERLIYSPSDDEDKSIYVFTCELRPVTPAIKREWKQLKSEIANDERVTTSVAAIMVKDSGPGLPASRAGDGRNLRVAECLACTHMLGRIPGVIWHDLDDDDCLRKERQEHAFALKGSKRTR